VTLEVPETEAPQESPHRIGAAQWEGLVRELGADTAVKPKGRSRARAPKPAGRTSTGEEPVRMQGDRSAWEIALELAGRLGPSLGDGKFAVLCINDAEHSAPPPDVTAERASGSCVLLPPAQDSMFGLPKCSHSHCHGLTLRRWIDAVGPEVWEEAVLQARGWRRARDFLLSDRGITGWKRVPFTLRDGADSLDGPQMVVPDEEAELCDFPVRIVSDVEEHDVTSSRRWYELEATVSGRTRRFRVAASEFNSLGWVATNLGPEAVISPGRDTAQHLRAAIQYLSKPVPRRDVYALIGWRSIRGLPVYVHAGGAVGEGGAIAGVSVALAGDVLPRFLLPAPPEGAALCAAVRASFELFSIGPAEICIPLFAAVWRAPLGPSPLTLYLSAPPTTGKSMLAALAQQHFGAGLHEGALPASVKHSTAASVNQLRSVVGDAVFVLDDFLVSGNVVEDLKLNEKVDSVVRAQYGGTGAQRLSRDGSLSNASTPPRSTLVITGETLPRGHSLRSRMLVLELPGPIERDLGPHKRAAADGLYAGAMAGYVRWLAPRLEAVRLELRETVLATSEKLSGERDHRTALLLAEVAVGVKYFLAFAVELGAVAADEGEQLRKLTWTTLQAMARAQMTHHVAQDPALRFCSLLAAALQAGRCHVALGDGKAPTDAAQWGWRTRSRAESNEEPLPEPADPVVDDFLNSLPPGPPPEGAKSEHIPVYQPSGPCVGVTDPRSAFVWIRAEVAHQVCRELAAGTGDPLPITLEDLGRRLHEKGLLAADELKSRRTFTVRKKIGARVQGGYLCMAVATLGAPEDDAVVSGVSTGVSDHDNG